MYRLLPLALLVAAPAAAFQDPVVFEDADMALRFTLPAGWSSQEVAANAGRQVLFAREDDPGLRLSLRAIPTSLVADAASLRDIVRGQVSGDGYREVELFELRRFERSLLAISAVTTSEPHMQARQAYLDHGRNVVLFESFVALDARERWTLARLEELWSGVELLGVPAPAPGPDAALKVLAARCGSELDWAATWEQAAARARAERKPILVHTRIYSGFALSDDAMVSSYMDPRVIALVRERYVPFQLKRIDEVPFADPELYGLSGTTFGTSVILATPDGRVLAEDIGPLYPFLVRGLTLDPELPGPAFEPPADPFEHAAALLARGEHDAAERFIDAQLEGKDDAQIVRIARLRADLEFRRRDAEAALRHLRLTLFHDEELPDESEISVDRARAKTLIGAYEEAHKLLSDFLEQRPDHPRATEARYWSGALAHKLQGPEAAAAIWRALAEEHPGDRWAWKAAGVLLSTAFSLDQAERLDWPSELELASVAVSEREPLPIAELGRVEAEALRLLLALQQPSGLWLHGGSYAEFDQGEPDELRQAITAIGGSALLAYRDQPGVEQATQRALARMVASYLTARDEEPRARFMDYSVWSRPYMIAFLADAVDAGLQDADEMAPIAAELIADLERTQRSNGGWSYYLTGDLEGSGAPEHSISFTTAAVVLGLVRGGEVGFPVPKPMVDRALDCLEAMRDPSGNFEYFLWEGARRGGPNPEPGAAGRGPACELALLRGGRGEDLDRLRRALQVFVEHRAGLMAEQGKALMHCGTSAQGSHYLTFDYATAAMAVAHLPAGEREKYRAPVLEALLAARGANGGFLDNPLLGWAAGTALGLHAIQALR